MRSGSTIGVIVVFLALSTAAHAAGLSPPPALAATVADAEVDPLAFDDLPLSGADAMPHDDIPSLGATLLKMFFGLLGTLGLVYLLLHRGVGKLAARARTGNRMRVVERVSLDARRALFLVEVDGQIMVVGAGEGGIVRLDARPAQEPDNSFAATLFAKTPANHEPEARA